MPMPLCSEVEMAVIQLFCPPLGSLEGSALTQPQMSLPKKYVYMPIMVKNMELFPAAFYFLIFSELLRQFLDFCPFFLSKAPV
jgi:hypothetical protein